MLACCSGRHTDPRLDTVASLAADQPLLALDSLGKIDYASLSAPNRHYFDLLKIKASDKAYMPHASDSLILDAIDYYSSHPSLEAYPEALYYGGRVCSDLGDYPTALKFFQQALAQLKNTDNLKLKGSVLAQSGRLMHQLRMYADAQSYIQQAISIDSILLDTINLAYDHQLIALSYLYDKKYDLAKRHIKKSNELGSKISKEFVTDNKVFASEIEFRSGNIDIALNLTRNLPDSVSPSLRNYALSNGADIYLYAGLLDSAYKYSYELITSQDDNNKRKGYRNILSQKLLTYSNPDSLNVYFFKYYNLLEDFYNKNESQLAVFEASAYNYKTHEKSKIEAERKYIQTFSWLILSIILILISAIVILILKLKEKRILFKLNKTLLLFNDLTEKIQKSSPQCYLSSNYNELRNWIEKKVSDIESKGEKSKVNPYILQSLEYKILQNLIKDGKCIKDSDPFWDQIQNIVVKSSPHFFEKLKTLIGNELKLHEKQTLILIKCGFGTSQISSLLGKTKTTISSRKKELSKKIIGDNNNHKALEILIRML
ncbi:MAG: tetratricopeptide repeat protein [Clostridium sp.]|nr:tetratricopeptide repeat protein [Clostridium sp.]